MAGVGGGRRGGKELKVSTGCRVGLDLASQQPETHREERTRPRQPSGGLVPSPSHPLPSAPVPIQNRSSCPVPTFVQDITANRTLSRTPSHSAHWPQAMQEHRELCCSFLTDHEAQNRRDAAISARCPGAETQSGSTGWGSGGQARVSGSSTGTKSTGSSLHLMPKWNLDQDWL